MKQLAGRPRPKYRLSPNEVEQLKKEETERRRKLRIVQVREQSKVAAAKIRSDVKNERKRQIIKLAKEIEWQMEDEKQEEVKRLEQRYDNTLRTIGQGHTQAKITDKQNSHAERQCTALENQQRAEGRGQEALRRVALDKAYQEYEDTRHVRDRNAALLQEKRRAAEVAARPPPAPDHLEEILQAQEKLRKPIPMTDMTAFSTTRYHMPEFVVEKAVQEEQLDGRAAGEDEQERTKEEIDERRKKEHDQLVRARIRGNEALKKEKLKHEYDDLMADLSLMQRADRRHRQVVVSKLPKQVFLPPDRRMEELGDKQMEMERAFEDMYLKQMDLSGNLSLTLDTNHAMSMTPAEEEDFSLTEAKDSPLVIPTMPAVNPALRELTNVSRSQSQTTQLEKPQTALKKLLNKIKEQRSEVEAEAGQGKLDSKAAGKGHKFTTARQPVNKPAADPDLELSPLRAPGNLRSQKSPAMREQEMSEKEDDEDRAAMSDDTEEGFLEELKGRLQAIEAQKDYLDHKMRQRQASIHQHQQPPPSYTHFLQQQPQQQQQQQPSAHHNSGSFSASAGPCFSSSQDPPPSLAQPSLARSWGPETQPQSTDRPLPFGAVVGQGVGVSGDTDYFRRPMSELQSMLSLGRPANQLSADPTLASTGYPGSVSSALGVPPPSMSGFPGSLGQQQPGVFTVGGGGGGGQASVEGFGVQSSANLPGVGGVGGGGVSAFGSFPTMPGGQLQPRSLLPTANYPQSSGPAYAGGGASLSGFSTLPPSAAGDLRTGQLASSAHSVSQTLASQPLNSQLLNTQQLNTQQFNSQLLNTQQLNTQQLNTQQLNTQQLGAQQLDSQADGSTRQPLDFESLTRRLAGGPDAQDQQQRLRDYQRGLVHKHQDRMRSLQEVRDRIHTRQTASASLDSAGLLSASLLTSQSQSQRLADPASLVPYTLKTTALESQSGVVPSSFSSSSTAQPFQARSSLLNPSSTIGGGFQTTSVSSSSAAAAFSLPFPSANRDAYSSSSTKEPILAGSSGMTLPEAGGAPLSHHQGDFGGGRGGGAPFELKASALATKLDSVRKSLPFDTPPTTTAAFDTPYRHDTDPDTDGVSGADDSHISSSTDRGSPALGGGGGGLDSRSNKSSTSGKSGLSGLSGGSSLGGSSLVARAEETRLGFEQRQKELQVQLAEIQIQKDALLQRYHGNQQRASTQEEDLRRKLKSAQAATASSSSSSDQQISGDASQRHAAAVSSSWDQPRIGDTSSQRQATALSLGVRQSGSPEQEEGSSSSRLHLSRARSLASELEEGSLSSDRGSGSVGARSWASELQEYSLQEAGSHKSPPESYHHKSPGSMTLEEFSITSDWSGGAPRDTAAAGKPGERSSGGRPGSSSLSSLEEYSITSANNGNNNRDAAALGSRESLTSIREDAGHSGSSDPSSGRGRLDIADLLQDLGGGGGWPAERSAPGGQGQAQPAAVVASVGEYEPHELSTILEVDTPQTAAKSATAIGGETSDKSAVAASRRFIDFGRKTSLPDDDKESKFSASGSSASSDVRSVIEVRPGALRLGGGGLGGGGSSAGGEGGEGAATTTTTTTTTASTTPRSLSGRVGDSLTSLAFRENVPEASTLRWEPVHDGVSPTSGVQSLELTQYSLTSEEAEGQNLNRGGEGRGGDGEEEGARGEGGGKGHADDVLKQARRFNQDLMAAIQRQSADVFDQSSLSSQSLSRTAADSSTSPGGVRDPGSGSIRGKKIGPQ